MQEYLLFNEQEILERVDEYALYCYYLGFEVAIGGKYRSPVRALLPADTTPSFGIFQTTRARQSYPNEFLWKDLACNLLGDIFDLVKILFRFVDRRAAMLKIMADFGIGGTPDGVKPVTLPHVERHLANPVHIEVASKPFTKQALNYWERINVHKPILDFYNITLMKAYWIAKDQRTPDYPKGMGFAYRIINKYQLYQPYAPRILKFRNNLTEGYYLGYHQLQYNSDLCVITKSYKDIACLRSFGYDAVAPQGENVLVAPALIEHLKKKYRKILVLFDNDGKHRGDEYEFEKVFVPKIVDTDKDTSDYCWNHGAKETGMMLYSILKQ